MARRTKEEVLAEFHHLREFFDAFLMAYSPNWSPDEVALFRSHIVTREEILLWMEEGKTTASGILSGVKSGLSDWKLALLDSERHHPEKAEIFHSSYV